MTFLIWNTQKAIGLCLNPKINCEVVMEDRFQFSIRKLEDLEEWGSDVAMLQQHMVEHLAMRKSLEHPSVTVFNGKRAP
uniref:Uncharacterized protein n=1 Tax=Ditylenchus dipsaci TaxID=166011 RepID=A0A915DGB4_9BILA